MFSLSAKIRRIRVCPRLIDFEVNSFNSMRSEFIKAIKLNQKDFGVLLEERKIEILADFFEIVMANNDLLHLVAPGSPENFATRHILESLTLLEHLPENAVFADIGAGAGLPSIPCLLVREDLRGFLIESSLKKGDFLSSTIEKLGLDNRTKIINKPFEETEKPAVNFVTSRALDKFSKKLAKLVRWSGKSNLLFFGGNNLRYSLQELDLAFHEKLTPQSNQRFLFILEKGQNSTLHV